MSQTYNIIEIANVHGGDKGHLSSLIDEFSKFKRNFGLKFQPFKYDEIATPDFEWYPIYEKLYFTPEEWQEVFTRARKTKDIWIDVFDSYTLRIIKENLTSIHGLKFQTSILDNRKLFRQLAELDLSEIVVMVNISGHNLKEIKKYIEYITKKLSPQELVIQVGFQSYPTKLEDSGLKKLTKIKKEFPGYRISFTEHLNPEDKESIRLPVVATLLGADIIEKHVCHSSLKAKYDFQSSVKPDKYQTYINLLNNENQADDFMNQTEKDLLSSKIPFINPAEAEYLKKTKQKPLAARDLSTDNLLCLESDLAFKRSPVEGLKIDQIEDLVKNFYILSKNKQPHQAFNEDDFKKAKLATIVACRVKSSRLPQKAVLKIGDISSVELCLKNALRFENIDHTILATSTTEEDSVLKDYTYDESVIFHKGHPDDVIDRYLSIVEKMGIDVIIRVTADMQYIDNEVAQILLKSHFEVGADYTSAKEASIGTNLEIINAKALRKVKFYFLYADYSEYMSYYFWNNPNHFKLNFAELPLDLVRNYRLTLDYPEDLEMFREIEEHFEKSPKKYSLRELFKFLDAHPEVTSINSGCTLKYKTDPELIKTLKRKTTIKDNP